MAKYEKLLNMVETNLKEVEEKGLNGSNLESVSTLLDMQKDIYKIRKEEKEQEEGEYGRRRYMGNYDERRYNGGGYMDGRGGGDYNARGGGNSGGGRSYNQRYRDHMNKLSEMADMYDYDKNQQRQYGGRNERVCEGLECMMYALCAFVEETMDYAETPEEKEIIRKHLSKLSRM